MCAPKHSLAPRDGRKTFPLASPSPEATQSMALESNGMGGKETGLFGGFHAPPHIDNTQREGQALRFPESTRSKIMQQESNNSLVDFSVEQRLIAPPERSKSNSALGRVYDFGETKPPEQHNDKIIKDIKNDHREMTTFNTHNRAGLEETYIDETYSNHHLLKRVNELQQKYGTHDQDDPEAVGYDLQTARAHNDKVRRDFVQDQLKTRQREGENPAPYSEEGLSVEQLSGRKLTAEEIAQNKREKQVFFDRLAALSKDETLNDIGPTRSVQDDEKAEQLWIEFNKRSENVVVPAVLFGKEVTSETYRQAAEIAEDTLNNVIRAKNFFTLQKTKNGDLIVIPKPEVSKNPAARLMGALATMFIPGTVGSKALKGVKLVQNLKKAGDKSKMFAVMAERATGSFITSTDKDSLLLYAFKEHPDLKDSVEKYFEGKATLETVTGKFFAAIEDGFPRKDIWTAIQMIKLLNRSDNLPSLDLN